MNPLLDLGARPIIGHRGASGMAPENTLAAFTTAVRQGAEAFELDVHLSADYEPVVIHDPTLDRTTDRSGTVADLTVQELKAANAGARFSPDGGRTFPFLDQGVRIPTLDEVLGGFPDMPLLIEIKTPAAQAGVRRVILAHGAQDRCVVAANDWRALAELGDAPFALGASRRDIATLYFGTWVGYMPKAVRYRLLAVPEQFRGLTVPTRRFVRAARELGCPVHVWTVNEPAAARGLWDRGVAGIVTNLPGVIHEAREAL
jgi:glycerophosphoryl diester phosphodiesterase